MEQCVADLKGTFPNLHPSQFGRTDLLRRALKELEEEGRGTDGRKASISEALQDLVTRLAGQVVDLSHAQSMLYEQQTRCRQAGQKLEALSACLAQSSKDPASKENAGATTSAYMEFGHQRIEAYDALRELADRYAKRRYGGSLKSEFNTMECIDLFHSKELDDLATKFSKSK